MLFVYGMRLRPAGPGCQPKDGFLDYGICIDIEFLKDANQTDFEIEQGDYHNLLTYNRKLTEDELEKYELDHICAIDRYRCVIVKKR